MSKSTTIGVDVAKNVFEVAISTRPGKVDKNKRLRRERFAQFFEQQPPCTVVMEACPTANYWGRRFQQMGHRVVLLPPHLIRPYVSRNKTDRCDAHALLEAYRNEDIHPVPIKSVDAQAVIAMHRLRSSWMRRRISLVNQVRGVLREFGIFIPQGPARVRAQVTALLASEPSGRLPGAVLDPFFTRIMDELSTLEASIKEAETWIKCAPQDPVVQRLQTIPGVGLLTASALVALVGDIRRFRCGRLLASYLGLTPREFSTGERRRLGGINKMGDVYVRTLLIHGARVVLRHAVAGTGKSSNTHLYAWAREVAARRGNKIATVALANKLARLVWVVWHEEKTFDELTYPQSVRRRPM